MAIAPASAPHSPAVSGNSGGSWRSAHQTTPATARAEIAIPSRERRERPRWRSSISSGRVAMALVGVIGSKTGQGWQTAPRMAAARELVIGDDPAAWRALGFAVGDDGAFALGGVRVRLALGWKVELRVEGLDTDRPDGLPVVAAAAPRHDAPDTGARRDPPAASPHRNARPRSTMWSSSPATATGPPPHSRPPGATCAAAAG